MLLYCVNAGCGRCYIVWMLAVVDVIILCECWLWWMLYCMNAGCGRCYIVWMLAVVDVIILCECWLWWMLYCVNAGCGRCCYIVWMLAVVDADILGEFWLWLMVLHCVNAVVDVVISRWCSGILYDTLNRWRLAADHTLNTVHYASHLSPRRGRGASEKHLTASPLIHAFRVQTPLYPAWFFREIALVLLS